ncbi:hypothetical protein [Cellulomonas sp. Marseille-Q8402]
MTTDDARDDASSFEVGGDRSGGTSTGGPAKSPRYGDRVEVVGWDESDAPFWDGPALVLAALADGTVEVVATGDQPAATGCECLGPCVGVFELKYLRLA